MLKKPKILLCNSLRLYLTITKPRQSFVVSFEYKKVVNMFKLVSICYSLELNDSMENLHK